MKKNVMMRVASILLVLVLMSSSVISGTFAKYVTDITTLDSARVAHWGVKFVTESNNLFKPTYDYKTQPTNVTGTVAVSSGEDVVAPGTSGTGYKFYTTGTPEVSYEVTFKMEDQETVFVDVDGTGAYTPISFTISLGTTTLTTTDISDVADTFDTWKYMYDVSTKHYYVDTGAGWEDVGANVPTMELTWAWKYHVDAATDTLDTILGNLAAGDATITVDSYNLEVGFKVTATATQVEPKGH